MVALHADWLRGGGGRTGVHCPGTLSGKLEEVHIIKAGVGADSYCKFHILYSQKGRFFNIQQQIVTALIENVQKISQSSLAKNGVSTILYWPFDVWLVCSVLSMLFLRAL